MASQKSKFGNMMPELICHGCQSVPRPNNPGRNRYVCFKSHTLCENCQEKCPCGSRGGLNALKIYEEIIAEGPWLCKNYTNGCRKIIDKAEDIEDHEIDCIFRVVYCPRGKRGFMVNYWSFLGFLAQAKFFSYFIT